MKGNRLLALAILFVGTIIGVYISLRGLDQEDTSYFLIASRNSFFIGCMSGGGEISACDKMADNWRIKIERALGVK